MAETITRRDLFYRSLKFGAGAAVAWLQLDACSSSSKKLPPEIIVEPKVIYKDAPLRQYITPEMVDKYELKDLASIQTQVYELVTTDGIPTSVHVYHPSIMVNADGIHATYELFNRSNVAKIVNALKEERTKSRDYQENPIDPEEVFFQYKYSDQNPTLQTGIFSYAGAVKQRLMLLVSDSNAPQWSKEGGSVTRVYIPPGIKSPVGSLVLLTVINVDQLNVLGGDAYLTAGVITEICHQTIKAIGMVNGKIAEPNSLEDRIAQEGMCNTFGYAGTLRRLGNNWQDANNFLKSIQIGVPGGVPPLRLFQLNESSYSLMPSNGLLLR